MDDSENIFLGRDRLEVDRELEGTAFGFLKRRDWAEANLDGESSSFWNEFREGIARGDAFVNIG